MDEGYPKTGELADIRGFSGYCASVDGRIVDMRTGADKPQRMAHNGAMKVDIGRSTQMVHNLIARAFYGHPTGRGYRVRHLNGALSDNHAHNLVWSGRPRRREPTPTLSAEIELEYCRVVAQRQEIAELMQT